MLSGTSLEIVSGRPSIDHGTRTTRSTTHDNTRNTARAASSTSSSTSHPLVPWAPATDARPSRPIMRPIRHTHRSLCVHAYGRGRTLRHSARISSSSPQSPLLGSLLLRSGLSGGRPLSRASAACMCLRQAHACDAGCCAHTHHAANTCTCRLMSRGRMEHSKLCRLPNREKTGSCGATATLFDG